MSGTLYIIATPIGNLEDISPRALRTLREVDILFCEDTRVTGKLLARYEITTTTESYREEVHGQKISRIIELYHERTGTWLREEEVWVGLLNHVCDTGASIVVTLNEEHSGVDTSAELRRVRLAWRKRT